jgi:hypothetical protein
MPQQRCVLNRQQASSSSRVSRRCWACGVGCRAGRQAIEGIPTTKMLIERLTADKQLRRLCGWERLGSRPAGFGKSLIS